MREHQAAPSGTCYRLQSLMVYQFPDHANTFLAPDRSIRYNSSRGLNQTTLGRKRGLIMRTIVTGATGLIGSALLPLLTAKGHDCVRLVRSTPSGPGELGWEPNEGRIDPAALDGFDGIVHLAGESIAEGRWTAEKKARIRRSRVEGTKLLADAICRSARPPRVLVCASAVGYYGDRSDETLTEESPPGKGFLADVCREWEKAADPAAARDVRVVHLRTGVVLSRKGGALAKMLLPFRIGVGGKIGSGTQYMSWIHIDDFTAIAAHALETDSLRGPVNTVSPNPVRNDEFTKALGKVLSRPTLIPLPAFAAELALGEVARELLLASQRVIPAKLLSRGFEFQFPEIEGALRDLLK